MAENNTDLFSYHSEGEKFEIDFTGLKSNEWQASFLLGALRGESIPLSICFCLFCFVFCLLVTVALGFWALPPPPKSITPVSAFFK